MFQPRRWIDGGVHGNGLGSLVFSRSLFDCYADLVGQAQIHYASRWPVLIVSVDAICMSDRPHVSFNALVLTLGLNGVDRLMESWPQMLNYVFGSYRGEGKISCYGMVEQ